MYRVFSQSGPGLPSPAELVARATRLFSIELEVLSAAPAQAVTTPSALSVRICPRPSAAHETLRVEARPARSEDWDAAQRAELCSAAAGMAALARRCSSVWQVHAEFDTPGLLGLCALLANLGLGPVLPPDESTLYGVRGALERLERLLGRRLGRGA